MSSDVRKHPYPSFFQYPSKSSLPFFVCLSVPMCICTPSLNTPLSHFPPRVPLHTSVFYFGRVWSSPLLDCPAPRTPLSSSPLFPQPLFRSLPRPSLSLTVSLLLSFSFRLFLSLLPSLSETEIRPALSQSLSFFVLLSLFFHLSVSFRLLSLSLSLSLPPFLCLPDPSVYFSYIYTSSI